MTYKILEGNALHILQTLEPELVDTVFTSPEPPYDYKQMEELIEIALQLPRVVKPTGSIWVQLGDYHNTEGDMTLIPERFVTEMVIEHGWHLRSKLIWHRPSDDSLEDTTRFKRDWEYLFWFVKNNPGYYFNQQQSYPMQKILNSSIIKCPYDEPAPEEFGSGFPQVLIQIAIGVSCPKQGMVLDPFAGTGTTGMTALQSSRSFIGIEANPMLIPKINKRLSCA